jgi:hypothetical protein
MRAIPSFIATNISYTNCSTINLLTGNQTCAIVGLTVTTQGTAYAYYDVTLDARL